MGLFLYPLKLRFFSNRTFDSPGTPVQTHDPIEPHEVQV